MQHASSCGFKRGLRSSRQGEGMISLRTWTERSRATRPRGVRMLADSIGAEYEETNVADNGMCDPAIDDVSVVKEDEREEEPFEVRLANLERAVVRQPLHRELLYKTLAFCEIRRTLREVEEEISTYPEFRHAVQDQYHLARVLEEAGGLKRIELDESGEEVLPERKEGLSEDEVDDLVCDVCFETTDLGREFVTLHSPKARLEELLGLVPARRSTYVEVLEFCETPRSYDDVKALLDGREILHVGSDGTAQPIQPSVFLDKLERAGAVVWEGGWQLTEGGRAYLGELKGI